MAYYSGVVSNFAGLRQALIDACVVEGWTWHSSQLVLEKGSLRLHMPAPAADYWGVTGRTTLSGGDMPNSVGIGTIGSSSLAQPVTWPAAYELFAFDDEVYLVINYSGDCYQWLAFGRSSVAGLPGTGMWVGATRAQVVPSASGGISINPTSGGAGGNLTSAALFHHTANSNSPARTAWLHSDLDSQGWWLGQTLTGSPVGIGATVPLLGLLPNGWNAEAVLLPIRAYKVRPQNKISLTADLAHARYTRVDNYEPGQTLTIGPDRWKVFPWYRKNAAVRDGGIGIDHTGTFGWAIRYEGP